MDLSLSIRLWVHMCYAEQLYERYSFDMWIHTLSGSLHAYSTGEDRTRTGQEPGVTQIDDRWVQTQGTDLERMSTVVAESPFGVRRMMKSSCVLHSWVC